MVETTDQKVDCSTQSGCTNLSPNGLRRPASAKSEALIHQSAPFLRHSCGIPGPMRRGTKLPPRAWPQGFRPHRIIRPAPRDPDPGPSQDVRVDLGRRHVVDAAIAPTRLGGASKSRGSLPVVEVTHIRCRRLRSQQPRKESDSRPPTPPPAERPPISSFPSWFHRRLRATRRDSDGEVDPRADTLDFRSTWTQECASSSPCPPPRPAQSALRRRTTITDCDRHSHSGRRADGSE